MWSAISALLKLLPLISFIVNWLEERAEKRRAAETAAATLAKEEARTSRAAAEILAERRPDSAGIDRLRDGSF